MLRHRFSNLIAVVAFLLAGCTTYSAPQQMNIRGSMPTNVKTITIRPVLAKADAIRNAHGLTDASALFSRFLTDSLRQKKPEWRLIMASQKDTTASGELIVTTELREIDGGSAALRFWIGFNAGAARSIAHVSITDNSGNQLADSNVTASTMCPVGACVTSNADMLERNLRDLADEVADFIVDPVDYQKRKTDS